MTTRKLVINRKYGGFQLSQKALLMYEEKSGIKMDKDDWFPNFKRDDIILIQIIENIGKEANGKCSELKIVEIPSDIEYFITEKDGIEQIEEKHRIWF